MDTVVNLQFNCTLPQCPKSSDMFGDNPLYVYDKPYNFLLICIYVPLILAALICNTFLIIVVSQNSSRGSVTNYFLVNLSVSDLLVTILCMPMAVAQATYEPWVYGNFMCKLSTYLQGVAVSSGVFTITAMSLNQCMAIIHPMGRTLVSREQVVKVIAFIWFLAMAVFGPILFVRKTVGVRFAWDTEMPEYLYCIESWPDNLSQRSFGIFCFVAVYAIPGVIVVFAYTLMGLQLRSHSLLPEYELARLSTASRPDNEADSNLGPSNTLWQVNATGDRLVHERRRIVELCISGLQTRLLAACPPMLAEFALCWLPFSVLTLILDLNSNANQKMKPDDEEIDDNLITIITNWIPFALLLGHISSVLNPILYCMLSKTFRSSFFSFVGNFIKFLRTPQQSTTVNVAIPVAPRQNEPNIICNNQISSHDESLPNQQDGLPCRVNAHVHFPATSVSDSREAETTPIVHAHCSKHFFLPNSTISSFTVDTGRPSTVRYVPHGNRIVNRTEDGDGVVTASFSDFSDNTNRNPLCHTRFQCSYKTDQDDLPCLCFVFKKWNAPLNCKYQARALSAIIEEAESQASSCYMSANSFSESSTNPEDWV